MRSPKSTSTAPTLTPTPRRVKSAAYGFTAGNEAFVYCQMYVDQARKTRETIIIFGDDDE